MDHNKIYLKVPRIAYRYFRKTTTVWNPKGQCILDLNKKFQIKVLN